MDITEEESTRLSVPYPKGISADFVSDLRTCLNYHHRESGQIRQSELQSQLESDFFTHLYVDRKELEEVRSAMGGAACVILSGLPGTGKSTILLKLSEEIRLQKDKIVMYLDLRDGSARLGEIAGASKAPVCGWVYERLSKVLLGDDRERLLDFYLFRIRENTDDSFETLRQLIVAKFNPRTDEDWRRSIAETDFIKEIAKRNEAPGDVELTALIKFLSVKLNGTLILILDNVDRFSQRLQIEVVLKCVDVLSRLCLPVVAIRSSNLRKIEEDGGTQSPYAVVELVHRRKGKDTQIGGESAVFRNLEVANRFIERRVEYLKELYSRSHRLNVEQSRAIDQFKLAMRAVFEQDHSSTIVSVLERWNNHSLRHLADAAISVALDVFRLGAPSTRATRTSVYRHMVFGSSFGGYQPEHGVVNVYRPKQADQCRLPFPTLVVLCLLRVSSYNDGKSELNHATTFGELRRLLAEVALSAKDLCLLLNSLGQNKQTEGLPFVFIHAKDGEIELSKTPDSAELSVADRKVVELMPRGEFLAANFVHTVEYLFWMAVANRTRSTSKLSDDMKLSESFRFYVASDYLKEELWPKLKEADGYGLRDAPSLATVLSTHFEGMSVDFVRKSLQSIERFSTHLSRLSKTTGQGRLDEDDLDWYRKGRRNVRWLESSVE